MKRIYFLFILIMSVGLNAMELEQSAEINPLDRIVSDLQNLIFAEVINQPGDIKDCYDAIKPLALTNKYYADYIPNWFVDFWYTHKNPENHSKIAIAAMCGAGGWIKRWLSKHENNNLSCKNEECCRKNSSYPSYNALLHEVNGLIPWMQALIHVNIVCSQILFKAMGPHGYAGYFPNVYRLFNGEEHSAEDILFTMCNGSIGYRNYRVAHYLLSLFKEDDKKDYIQTVLFKAILQIIDQFNNKKAMAQFAIDHGADMNKGSKDIHLFPLRYAAILYQIDMFKFLLEAGANPYLPDHDGESANAFLLRRYQEAIVQQNQKDIQYYGELIKLVNEHGLKMQV